MPVGKVKWFDVKKGFGFIEGEGGDVFVHYSVIQTKGFRSLVENEMVEFELEQGPKGMLATKVIRLEADAKGKRVQKPPEENSGAGTESSADAYIERTAAMRHSLYNDAQRTPLKESDFEPIDRFIFDDSAGGCSGKADPRPGARRGRGEGAWGTSRRERRERGSRRMRRDVERVARLNQLAEMGKLAAGLAHELKNPLSTLKLNLQLLEEDLQIGSAAAGVGVVGGVIQPICSPALRYSRRKPTGCGRHWTIFCDSPGGLSCGWKLSA